jgi:hypothetical protein
MPPTMIRSSAPRVPTRSGRAAAGWAAAGLAVLVAAVGAGEVLEPPTSVDLTIANEAAEAVTVAVSDGASPILPIGTIDPGEERPVAQVLDQGGRWTVRFQRAGEVVGEQTLTREELAAQGMRITVPASVDG